MKTLLLLVMVAAPMVAQADVVLEWNEATLQTIRSSNTPPPVAARALAMVHAAIYDAVNSIAPTHQPFRAYFSEYSDASAEAAAAQAAYRVLLHLYPNERLRFDRSLINSLAAVRESSAKASGIRLGNAVADEIIAWRSQDGSQASAQHPPGTQPGVWRPTPPEFRPALLPHWSKLAPFGIQRVSQFRAAYPPALDSSEYARDVDEVWRLGGVNSRFRTPEQAAIAYFWADGAGTVTPPGHWNRIAQSVALSTRLPMRENARLFALLNVALADAAIVCWDMKFTCNFWRPITAINEAENDGNPQTQADPFWRPLLDTPPFPTCTSGHSTFSGAASEMLSLLFGRDDVPFTDVSELGSGSRTFTRFSQAAEEAGRSRIYGGIHFQFDNHTGLSSGRAVAREIFERHFRPLPNSAPSYAANQSPGQTTIDRISVNTVTPRVVTSYYRPNADETR